MKKLKEIKIVLLIFLVVFVLVIVKSTGENRFKQDAKNVIETVENNNFSISMNDFVGSENQFLVVDLNESGSVLFENSIKVPFEKLIDETILEKLKETENKILLMSDDHSDAIKAWVILNQLDFKNVFVLSDEENTEDLKYEFQTETGARLESFSE